MLGMNREINSVANCNAQRVSCVSALKHNSSMCSLGVVVLISKPSIAFGHHFNAMVSWGKSLQGTIAGTQKPDVFYSCCLLSMLCIDTKMLCYLK